MRYKNKLLTLELLKSKILNFFVLNYNLILRFTFSYKLQ